MAVPTTTHFQVPTTQESSDACLGPAGSAAHVTRVVRMVQGRWKLPILFRLFADPTLRTLQLKRDLGSISQKVLTQHLRELAEEKKVSIIAFVEDVAASGGYMIACAADEIVCDPASIVGSIGVIGASFGFADAMKKLGIERRIYTAGESKSMLDPFLPEKEEDVRRLTAIQQDIHQMFIELVRGRRGAKLRGPEKAMFSGEYWAATTAKEFGLIDEIGEVRSFLRRRYGEEVATPLITMERRLFGRRLPGVTGNVPGHILEGVGDRSGLVEELLSAIERRAIWGRFGP